MAKQGNVGSDGVGTRSIKSATAITANLPDTNNHSGLQDRLSGKEVDIWPKDCGGTKRGSRRRGEL